MLGSSLFEKGITTGMKRGNDQRCSRRLRDMIVAGRLHPGRIVPYRLPFAEAPQAYQLLASGPMAASGM